MKDATNHGSKSISSTNPTVVEPPEFISTHPNYDTRLSNFTKWMPDAMEIYNADSGLKCKHVREEMSLDRKKAAKVAWEREMRNRNFSE
jgi:hypothetical protein